MRGGDVREADGAGSVRRLRKIQLDGEGGAFAFFAFEGYLTVVVQNDVLGIGQSEPCSLRFIGKIGLEDPGLGFFGNAGTVIRDPDDAFVFSV